MNIRLEIGQTLHGYADGHQLLASSAALTSEQKSTLLVMSDLSGPAVRSGYETYLTGYPLVGGYYCFARTWFAPELPRPGCVWTQTLLIRSEDLALIINFDELNKLFRRPSSPLEFSEYKQPIEFNQGMSQGRLVAFDCRDLLQALYGTEKCIVIPSESSQPYEILALAILEQQWPRLRRSFRFCSGALAFRAGEFDLSISPPESIHSLGERGIVVQINKTVKDRSSELWIEFAYRDLISRLKSDYRDFLWRFGPDEVNGRAAFMPLTQIYCLLDEKMSTADELLSAIDHFYPEPQRGVRVKKAIFGQGGSYTERIGGEANTLRVLISHIRSSAIPEEAVDVMHRAAALTKSDPEGAIQLADLATQIGGRNGKEFLQGFVERSDWDDSHILSMPIQVLFDVLENYPDLAGRPSVWSRADKAEIASRLFAEHSSSVKVAPTISAMITAKAYSAMVAAMAVQGDSVAAEIFLGIDTDVSWSTDYPDYFSADLAQRNTVWAFLIEQGKLGPRATQLLSAELDPRSRSVRRVGFRSWLKGLQAETDFESQSRSLKSNVFMLGVGLSNYPEEASSLIVGSYHVVYQAAATRSLPDDLWQRLEPVLSWYSPSWDRCARLVRSVAIAFKERDWNPRDLFQTFSSAEQFERALSEIDDLYGGPRYIRGLKAWASSAKSNASSDQLKALASF